MNNPFNLNEEEKSRIKSLHGMQVINEQETTEPLTDQQLRDMVDLGKDKVNWKGTNDGSLYRTTIANSNLASWRGSIVHKALKKAKWNVDNFINQNEDLVKRMMKSGTHFRQSETTPLSREDVKRLLEIMVEQYEEKKTERDRLESFRTGIKSIVDIYERELGIDRTTQIELEELLRHLTNKDKNGFDNDRWDVRYLKRSFPNAVTLLPPSKVMDIFCKLKK